MSQAIKGAMSEQKTDVKPEVLIKTAWPHADYGHVHNDHCARPAAAGAQDGAILLVAGRKLTACRL